MINIHSHQKSSNNLSIRSYYEEPIKIEHYFSIGIHPWYLENLNISELIKYWNHPLCIAIGEIGLDRLKKESWDEQIEIFENQLKLAPKNKPIILHCVKSYYEIIQILQKLNIENPCIFHDFNASIQITNQLLKNNQFYFSYGKSLFRNKSKGLDSLKTIPIDRIFLETDESNFSIDSIYLKFAQIRKMEISDLIKKIENNFISIFPSSLSQP